MIQCFIGCKIIVLCFLCLSPEPSKNAEGIGVVSAYFCRELVLVRKYDNTTANPRNEGFTWFGGFYCFCLKRTKEKISDNIHYILI